ncbi:hypothetical protein [Botrimarina mediterranea]|uniref:hypothetical protein n=1 Tax=Botrimarina mediterranea TaxID=2528022 RepID=UPI001E375FDF|nr:hypothetical protein [Botrimarina mediterranea]
MATPVVGGILSDQAAAVRMINDQMLRMTNDQRPSPNDQCCCAARGGSPLIGHWGLVIAASKKQGLATPKCVASPWVGYLNKNGVMRRVAIG